MKQIAKICVLIAIVLTSCKTTYVDKTGNSHNTWVKNHTDRVHNYRPFYAGKQLITPAELKSNNGKR